MPGGKGRPAVNNCIFSAAARSALALPSANAATIEIVEHLLVGGRPTASVDTRPSPFSFGVERQAHHAAAGLALDLETPSSSCAS